MKWFIKDSGANAPTKNNDKIAIKPGNIEDLIKATLKLTNKDHLKKLGSNSKVFYKKNFELKLIKNKLYNTLKNLKKWKKY